MLVDQNYKLRKLLHPILNLFSFYTYLTNLSEKVDLSAVYLTAVSLTAVYLAAAFGAALNLTSVYIAAVYLTIVYYTALDCYVHDFSVNFCSLLNVSTQK